MKTLNNKLAGSPLGKLVKTACLFGLLWAANGAYAASTASPDNKMNAKNLYDTDSRQALVSTLANKLAIKLEQGYVFPEKAKQLSKMLRGEAFQASLLNAKNTKELASLLTTQLQSASGDKHLMVEYSSESFVDQADKESDAAREAFELEMWRAHNFGVQRVERMRFNIGYFKLSAFGPVEQVGPLLASAMTLLNNTESLIIDLRGNFGGDEQTVQLLASYLLNKRTHLLDMHKPLEDRIEQHWSFDYVEGPKFGEDKPVYILIDQDSFSAAEDFSYSMKNLKRATLVGKTTGGAANSGEMVSLDSHFSLFLPSSRGVSPITKTNWQGVGVAPDLESQSESALNRAQIDILTRLLQNEQDERRVQRIKSRIAELQA